MSTPFFPDESFGLLRVNTFLKNPAFPAGGAQIVVSSTDGEVISELVTNAEGQLPPIRLPAPPLQFSQDSDMPRPFSQVFPDSTAVQNISFTSPESNIDIPYPVLWGDYPDKIPESEIKRLPFPDNLVVLPEPVIPEFIVVHDGVPSDSRAPDYTLTFKDYINKNWNCSILYNRRYRSWKSCCNCYNFITATYLSIF